MPTETLCVLRTAGAVVTMALVNGGLSYATGEPWSGRTRLNDTLTVVRSRLSANRTLSAAMMLEWLSEFEKLPDQSTDVKSPIAAQAEPNWLDAGFPGWVANSPPRPYYTSPIPLGLELPLGGECPLAELQPWWNQLALYGESTAPIAFHSGRHTRIGQWGRFGWEPGSVKDYQADHGQFDVYATHLNVWGRAKETNTRISGPGFFGSLVPGYAEVRELASSMSKESAYFGFGCRVDFAFISAVTLNLEWHRKAPPMSAPLKELVRRRGYGELHEASIGIELTDGWRPWRIQLMQGAGGTRTEEIDQLTIAFAQWLVMVIATHRRRQPYVAARCFAVLEDLASKPRQLWQDTGSKMLRESFRCSFPASLPISWRSPA